MLMKPNIVSKNVWNQWLVICLYDICENYKFHLKKIVHMTSEYPKRIKNNQNLHLTLTFDLEKVTSRSNGYLSQIPHILFIWITYFIFINMITGWCNMTITNCTSCILEWGKRLPWQPVLYMEQFCKNWCSISESVQDVHMNIWW